MSDAPQIAVQIAPAPAAKPITLKARLKWPDVNDDYVVHYEGHLIGRIRLGDERYAQGTTWEWSIAVPMAMPDWANGSAENRDACMKDFNAAWGRFLKETDPARLERAWELERAAAARHQRLGLSQTEAT
jgi:hypothetical protein